MNKDKSITSLYYGPVILYYNKSHWKSETEWFRKNGFKVVEFDASTWSTIDDLYSDLHEKFLFPNYFGRNLDATVDCLRDLDFEDCSGILVTIENYDVWHTENKRYAFQLLDIFACVSYEKLVGGNKLIVHVQTNNPREHFPDIGARSVAWNMKEWSDSNRGI